MGLCPVLSEPGPLTCCKVERVTCTAVEEVARVPLILGEVRAQQVAKAVPGRTNGNCSLRAGGHPELAHVLPPCL